MNTPVQRGQCPTCRFQYPVEEMEAIARDVVQRLIQAKKPADNTQFTTLAVKECEACQTVIHNMVQMRDGKIFSAWFSPSEMEEMQRANPDLFRDGFNPNESFN